VSVSDDASGSAQLLPVDVAPAISANGDVVAYEASTPDGGRQVWVRDRAGATSRPVAALDSAAPDSTAPGISGNGCVVAYSVLRDDDVELTVVDRCATKPPTPLPAGTRVDGVGADPGALSAPALSFDGSTIVWATGSDVRRYVRPDAGGVHRLTETIVPTAPDAAGEPVEFVTGTAVDVSADGTTVVFVAAPRTQPPAPTNVYLWSSTGDGAQPLSVTAAGEPGADDSVSPTISADGTFVVFESSSPDLAVAQETTPKVPFVVGVDRTSGEAQILVDDASSPAVSGDGSHVAYRNDDAVRVWSFDGTSVVDEAVDELAAARPSSRISISQHGRWLVFATAADLVDGSFRAPPAESAEPATTAPSVWAVDRRSVDVGVGDTTSTTSTTVATEPTTPTTTTASTTPNVPTSTTPPTTAGDAASLPTVPASTSAPSVVITRFPTSGGAFPRVVVPPSPPRPVFPGAPRPFTPGVQFDQAAFASPVEFEPTVVDAGRRTAAVTLTNATSSTIRVSSITVDAPGGFALVGDGCSGLAIAAFASCSVDVQFTPVTIGRSVGSTTFQLSDGTSVTAALGGEGVGAPTLDLVPGVAGAGQTVTVFGAGFPAGSTVELMQPGVASAEPVVVGADGTFAHVVVVLPNTPTGPTPLTVYGQPDVFADVAAELLVSTRGGASGDAALRGGPVGAIGR
jgi:hypothetical protein